MSRFRSSLFLSLISLTFYGVYQPAAQAGCASYEAVGWFTNQSTGERSNEIRGRSFRCGNAYSAGAGFRSADLKVTTTICTIEEICTDTNFELNTTYVTINQPDSMASEQVKGDVLAWSKDSITIKAKNSPISYSWKDAKYIPSGN